MDYQKEYDALVSGKKTLEDFQVSKLFAMASHLAVKGNFEAKADIYFNYISGHPRVSENDLFNVETYRFDLQRRKGDPAGALQKLLALRIPAQIPAGSKALYWQAVGQCYLKQLDYKNATNVERKILALPEFNKFPVDQKLYFLETMFDMKILSQEVDRELYDFFKLYEILLQDSSLTDLKKDRAEGMYYRYKGDVEKFKTSFTRAAEFYIKYFDVVPSKMNKADAAWRILLCIFKGNLKESREEEFRQFFLENRKALFPTGTATYKQEYNFVLKKLGIKV